MALLVLCGTATGVRESRADGVVPAGALVTAREGVLNLRTGDVSVADLANWLDLEAFPAAAQYGVIMLDGPMDPGARAMLENAGVKLRGYLPSRAWMADLSGATPAGLRATGLVRWAGAYEAAWKVDADLLAPGVFETQERRDLEAQGVVAANLWLFEGETAQATMARVQNMAGASITGVSDVAGGVCVHALLPRARVVELSQWSELQYAEPLPEYAPRSNTLVRALVQSGTTNQSPFYTRGLIGTGEILAIIDGRVDINHCSFLDDVNPVGDLHRKVQAYNTTPGADGHGTHVAGTALGAAGTTGDTRGVAYGARMVFNTYPSQTEASMFERLSLHASQGARLHSNSWGAPIRAYDGGSRAIDAFQFGDEDQLVVFAVANSGLVANPENAKNCLAVAATRSGSQLEQFCSGSTGPTVDGRRKPEVMAPGCSTVSSAANTACSVASSSGTSMATPAVSGLAVLLREYFLDGFYPSGAANPADALTPSGSLLRAALVNSAVDVTGIAGNPSTVEGWGRVVGDRVAFFAGDARKLLLRDVRKADGGLSTGQRVNFTVDVGAGQSLRATLAWADAPAAVNATFTPINNLNLQMRAPDGTIYVGNNVVAGESQPGGTFDAINNLEVVSLATPLEGRWTVSIIAAEVSVETQGYAIVLTGDVQKPACDGDYNQDENVDLLDAQQLGQVVAGIIQPDPTWLDGDFNGDGNVDLTDAQQMAQAVAFGTGCP
jgi:hypothetical protein